MKYTINLISSKNLLFIFATCLFAISYIPIGNVSAQELKLERIPYQDVSSGSLYFKNDNSYFAALTQNSDYQVSINGLLARVNFTQTFKNSSDEYLEAVYVFPLIDDAAVDSMIMEIGERRIIGKIKEKNQAQKLYKKAKQQGKKVSLVSQQRPNLFTTKLANIAPGESIKISLSYLQSVTLNDETFSLRIPLTLTPRYIPSPLVSNNNTNSIDKEARRVENRLITSKINAHGWAVNNARVIDASEITPFQMRAETLNNDDSENLQQTVTLVINLNTVLPLTNVISRYHKINKDHLDNKLSISLLNEKILLNQDFVLQWQLAQGDSPKAAFFQQSDYVEDSTQALGGYHYGLLMVMPPKDAYAQPISKEVVYIIDTSGSMGGVAIRQAKQSLIAALDLLNSHDSFNIISFDDDTLSLFELSKPANMSNIKTAKHWLSKLNAGGGTNMYPALEQALQSSQDESTYRQVIFVTDGSVGNEDELFVLINRKLGNTRLHTIGIGSAPNGYFMSQAAKVGRGTYRYIGSTNEVKEKMTALFSQIGKPLMQDVKVTWPVDKVEMFPENIPDLYSGQPLLVSARWTQTADKRLTQTINVSGELASAVWQEKIDITNEEKEVTEKGAKQKVVDKGVAQWWAKQKINHLTVLQRRSSIEDKPKLKTQITQLALDHHLMSPYTSFIAVEEKISRKEGRPLNTKGIKNLMPKGSTQIVPLAKTALGLMSYFYIGLLFIIVAFFIQLKTKIDFRKSC
jgi:Ca-activated chloride channel family protein